MKRSNLVIALILMGTVPLFGATSLENSSAYTQAARVSYDAGFVQNAAEYADTAISYCESNADAWYLKTLAEKRLNPELSVLSSIETLEHAFQGGAFWVNESEYDACMSLADMCYITGRYSRAAELLQKNEDVTEEKLILLSKVLYGLGEKDSARECIETGIQIYPDEEDFYIIYFMNEKAEDVREDSLCLRLTRNVNLFDPTASDIYLYASKFVDEETSERYVRLYGQYNAANPLYAIYALEKGIIHFEEALYLFDSLCHDGMRYEQFSCLCSYAGEDDFVYLYAFLDAFNGVLLFTDEETGLTEMSCSYRYGRPYTVSYDRDCDSNLDMLVYCDYGTPVSVQLPSAGVKLEYNRYPYVEKAKFAEPAISLEFARNACAWKAVSMEKAAFTADNFAFYIPVKADSLEDVSPVNFYEGCSTIECTTDDPAGCKIRIVMNGGKPVDAFYTVRGKLYAHAYFKNGKLLYRDVDMDGDGLYELSEQYLYDEPEPDPVLIGNRIYGTVTACFETPRFSVLLSDGDGDGVYEYEETMNSDGTSDIVWY